VAGIGVIWRRKRYGGNIGIDSGKAWRAAAWRINRLAWHAHGESMAKAASNKIMRRKRNAKK